MKFEVVAGGNSEEESRKNRATAVAMIVRTGKPKKRAALGGGREWAAVAVSGGRLVGTEQIVA